MTTDKHANQNQPLDHDKKWEQVVWKIFKIDDQGKCEAGVERFDNHLIMTVPFAKAFQERAEEAKQRVLRNQSSPIEYFMYKRLLDPKALAEAMDMAVWRLKRHFKPSVFRKLDHEKLRAYAKIFKITVDDLITFREDA